ncbi:hypothetical protein ACELLULO517_11415 [Acidisoma cellulosilytica]|uniref:ATPase n=1 Tax=Acidisoma cellulosilyticum TaxID=2802395 RepID=A0A964E3W1_9PROT|nr:ATP12 family protein [Acidisoma cellulosilyticum]MCB8880844.1 hypothetical protein [Acidisoma cellulosilyticum]
MKRFWTETSIAAEPAGFTLLLDGKPMRLPGGEMLLIDRRALAEAIAAEWQATVVGLEVQPQDLPLTQLAATATLRIATNPADTATAIAAYGQSDLLCYRVAEPEMLAQRQKAEWQPWLDWAAQRYDAPLTTTTSLGFVAQNPQSLAALAQAVSRHDAHGLAVLGVIVPVLGSLVLGLAMVDGKLAAAEAYRLSTLDELFQEERWGQDDEAADRRAFAARDVIAAGRYFQLSRRDA